MLCASLISSHILLDSFSIDICIICCTYCVTNIRNLLGVELYCVDRLNLNLWLEQMRLCGARPNYHMYNTALAACLNGAVEST